MSRFLTVLVVATLTIAGAFKPYKFSSRSAARSTSALDGSIYEELGKEGNYNSLLKVIDAAGMKEVYDGEGLKTIFAPNGNTLSQILSTTSTYIFSISQMMHSQEWTLIPFLKTKKKQERYSYFTHIWANWILPEMVGPLIR